MKNTSYNYIMYAVVILGVLIMKNNTMIFGDSYSTFNGFVPDGFAAWYSENGRPETDVTAVEQTWWHQVCKEANLNLVLNNSWSGSTISYTRYNNEDCSKTSSFIRRLRNLIEDGFFNKNKIDTVFVFGGTNDSWVDGPLGEMKFADWEERELFWVLPAICYFFNLLKETLPNAKIYCLINTELKPEIVSCMEKVCEKHGIAPVNFDTIDKRSGHPTIQGMKDIKEAVLRVIKD